MRALTLSMEDLREVPDLARVLGGSPDRAWQVGALLKTPARWHLCRSDEAHRIGKERDLALSALRASQLELANVLQSSSRQAADLERALFECDCLQGVALPGARRLAGGSGCPGRR